MFSLVAPLVVAGYLLNGLGHICQQTNSHVVSLKTCSYRANLCFTFGIQIIYPRTDLLVNRFSLPLHCFTKFKDNQRVIINR